ncbi:SgcJ/EcaC family oxidoreductase [Paraburkholderia azotifigens]|uniref:SgcJ/EcaC family oxidoreductase n=1 Tax=Paraburkholderia azotifigens TaxID=2057004 RepID=UPI00316F1BAF
MTDDERAIRQLIDTWLAASKAGDTATVLSLMTDDVIFMVPGQKPFGKAAFMAASEGQKNISIDGKSEILELQVLGDWAFLRSHLDISLTPKDGSAPPMRLAGNTMTILRKETDGRWLLARDANLLVPQSVPQS